MYTLHVSINLATWILPTRTPRCGYNLTTIFIHLFVYMFFPLWSKLTTFYALSYLPILLDLHLSIFRWMFQTLFPNDIHNMAHFNVKSPPPQSGQCIQSPIMGGGGSMLHQSFVLLIEQGSWAMCCSLIKLSSYGRSIPWVWEHKSNKLRQQFHTERSFFTNCFNKVSNLRLVHITRREGPCQLG